MTEPGYAIKMYPSQFGTHFTITAGLDIHRQLAQQQLDASAIDRAVLTTPSMPYVDRPAPASGLAGKFSWQYTFACAVLDGAVTMGSFEDDRRFAPDMEALLERLEVTSDPTISGRFDEMHVAARITLTNGDSLQTSTDGPPGSWRAAPLARSAHLAKVRDCLD